MERQFKKIIYLGVVALMLAGCGSVENAQNTQGVIEMKDAKGHNAEDVAQAAWIAEGTEFSLGYGVELKEVGAVAKPRFSPDVVELGELITLFPVMSPNYSNLKYHWRLEVPEGSKAKLSCGSSMNPSFVVDVLGDYRAILAVESSSGAKYGESSITIMEVKSNKRPVIGRIDMMEGPYFVGQIAHLFAYISDKDSSFDSMQAIWKLEKKPLGSGAHFNDDKPKPQSGIVDIFSYQTGINSFLLDIDKAGEYVISLVLSDGQVLSEKKTVRFTTENRSPYLTLSRHGDLAEKVGEITSFAATYSDLDNDALALTWKVLRTDLATNKTEDVTLSAEIDVLSDEKQIISFTLKRRSSYTIRAEVSDGKEVVFKELTRSVQLDLTRFDNPNNRPVQTAAGKPVTLQEEVINPENGELSYKWSMASENDPSTFTLNRSNDGKSARFLASQPGGYRILLQVSDDGYEIKKTFFVNVSGYLPQAKVEFSEGLVESSDGFVTNLGDEISLKGVSIGGYAGELFCKWSVIATDRQTKGIQLPNFSSNEAFFPSSNHCQTQFKPPVPGAYVITLLMSREKDDVVETSAQVRVELLDVQ